MPPRMTCLWFPFRQEEPATSPLEELVALDDGRAISPQPDQACRLRLLGGRHPGEVNPGRGFPAYFIAAVPGDQARPRREHSVEDATNHATCHIEDLHVHRLFSGQLKTQPR